MCHKVDGTSIPVKDSMITTATDPYTRQVRIEVRNALVAVLDVQRCVLDHGLLLLVPPDTPFQITLLRHKRQ